MPTFTTRRDEVTTIGRARERVLHILRGLSRPIKRWTECRLILRSGFFDTEWYGFLNAQAHRSIWNSATHYLKYGASSKLYPSINFDAEEYLIENPDVQSANANPLVHYLRYGRFEGRPAYPITPTKLLSLLNMSGDALEIQSTIKDARPVVFLWSEDCSEVRKIGAALESFHTDIHFVSDSFAGSETTGGPFNGGRLHSASQSNSTAVPDRVEKPSLIWIVTKSVAFFEFAQAQIDPLFRDVPQIIELIGCTSELIRALEKQISRADLVVLRDRGLEIGTTETGLDMEKVRFYEHEESMAVSARSNFLISVWQSRANQLMKSYDHSFCYNTDL